jgi:hypothetical protein
MKHDRWVKPKGELPEPAPRLPRADDVEREEIYGPFLPSVPRGPGDPGEVLMADRVDGEEMLFLERELYGTFHFRDTVLDQLELYWTYLRRMKRRDPDAFAIYRRLGATIMPPAAWLMHDGPLKEHPPEDQPTADDVKKQQLTAWWKQHRPAFGCVSYGISPRVESYELNPSDYDKQTHKGKSLWVPRFLYFTKFTQPPSEVQPTTGGDVYAATIWWDRAFDPTVKLKAGVPQEFHIYISKSGHDIHLLKQRETYYVDPKHINNRFRTKSGARGRKKPHAGRAMKVYNGWHYPPALVEMAKRRGIPTDVFLCNIFLDTARAFEATGFGMTRVEVTNGDMSAVFSVDPRRMHYFFKDRDITLTKNGHRQHIFHLVKPHTIRQQDGTTRYVSFSFRGLREFDWAGYHVKITIPGRDHFALNEFDVGSVDEEYAVDGEKLLGAAETAELLHGWMDDGVVGSNTD